MPKTIKSHVLNPTTGKLVRKTDPVPTRKSLLQYSCAGRRGASVGKSAWKPGGSAHKTGTALDSWGREYAIDLVTGKRVVFQHHSVEVWAGLKATKLEKTVRRLYHKAEHGGLTTKEMESFILYSQDELIRANVALSRLIEKVVFNASRPRPDAGRVLTNRRKKAIFA